jgi:hypothetical protein
MSAEISVPINQTVSFNKNVSITVVSSETPKPTVRVVTPSNTAMHEAKHFVVGEKRGAGPKMASIAPTTEFKGITIMSKYDAAAAAAAHADGMSGTSWDLHIIQASGDNVHAAVTTARSILSDSKEEVEEVAIELEEKKTISNSEGVSAMKRGKEKKEGIEKVEEIEVFVYISRASKQEAKQEKKKLTLKKKGNVIFFPGAELEEKIKETPKVLEAVAPDELPFVA